MKSTGLRYQVLLRVLCIVWFVFANFAAKDRISDLKFIPVSFWGGLESMLLDTKQSEPQSEWQSFHYWSWGLLWILWMTDLGFHLWDLSGIRPINSMAEAIVKNFTRYKLGDKLIVQEMKKLLALDQLHHPNRPLLTEDGRVKLRNNGKVEIGLSWSETLQLAPEYFSKKYHSYRGAEYSRVVHGDFTRMARQLAHPPHCRTVLWRR